MYLSFKVQFLTDEQGIKTAVQIPFNEWTKLMDDYSRLKKLVALKNEIKIGLSDLIEIEKGNSKEITLTEFLDEN